ncbi:MAG: aminoacyl-histidine dipeptidase [Paludibacteraceae bacterium]|nr:aminoacyl-histidine dipeptidase [Paludibacteraceae bacterium]
MNTLEPKEVFSIFEAITRVPRPSKHEELISQWLIDFAAAHHLECVRDDAMNVIMRCPATPGYESHEGVILQAHMDMVCEKNSDTQHDFMTDPIQTYVDGEWLKAKGTTLGGDDGIGMAMALAIITATNVPHPALECLFTVDEETGLTGAFKLKDGYLRGRRLINLDSEDDGQIFIGCAGGIDTLAKMHYEPVTLAEPQQYFAFRVAVKGLMGGHSGDDINKGRANANKIIVHFLNQLTDCHYQLAVLAGGNLRNAIAREAEAVLAVPHEYKHEVVARFNMYSSEVHQEYDEVEKDMQLTLDSCAMPELFLPQDQALRLVQALVDCPHGMIAMSQDMPGLVETSTNLASIKMKEGYIEVNTSQRSSIETEKHRIKDAVEAALATACDTVTHGDGYPGWKPNVHSPLMEITKQAYHDLFHAEPAVLAIHAGLECGLFLQKYPYLDMVSIGPQMYGVHSPQERLSIPSTQRCYAWLKQTLKNL